MSEPNVNGVEIKVGDVWETRDGNDSVRIFGFRDSRDYPVAGRSIFSGVRAAYGSGGEYSLVINHPYDLRELISREKPVIADDAEVEATAKRVIHENAESIAALHDEPELPEDIADQFEVNPDYRYFAEGVNILAAFKDGNSILFVWSQPGSGIGTGDTAIDLIESGDVDSRFRRKGHWEPIKAEKNTVTGEIREVGDE